MKIKIKKGVPYQFEPSKARTKKALGLYFTFQDLVGTQNTKRHYFVRKQTEIEENPR